MNIEDVYPAQEMFAELLYESSEFHSRGGEPCASVGDFIRSEVQVLSLSATILFLAACLLAASIAAVLDNKLHLDLLLAQVQQRAAEKWKDVDATTRSLRLCVISNMLKVECCVNGTHSLDDIGLGAYGLYKTLPGLDCTFPGFVLQH